MLIIIIITVLWVWVSWIEKKKYKDERHDDDHLRPRRTHFHAKKPWVNHLNTLFMHTGLWAVWGITSDKSAVLMFAFLLLRWSRCLLPSPRMWLETWTTKTWFTSLLMERRRTRSEPSFKCVREVESQFVYPAVTWNWLTAHEGNVDYLLSFYATIVSVLSSLKSRGRILTNSLFQPVKMGSLQHQTSSSVVLFFCFIHSIFPTFTWDWLNYFSLSFSILITTRLFLP